MLCLFLFLKHFARKYEFSGNTYYEDFFFFKRFYTEEIKKWKSQLYTKKKKVRTLFQNFFWR